MLEKLHTFRLTRRNEEGASAVEYGLLVALIAAVVVVAVFALGSLVRNTFQDTCTSIEANGNSSSDSGCGGTTTP
jgi:pilus assembly protein Flp/PilA